MNKKEMLQYEMLLRVNDFGRSWRELDDVPPGLADMFERLAGSIQSLTGALQDQFTRADGASKTTATTARKDLIARLKAIDGTARVISVNTPGFDDPFRCPRRQPDCLWAAMGHAIAREAEPVRSRFIAYGMRATFIEELHASAEQFERSVIACETSRSERISTRVSIAHALARGLQAVRILDVMMTNRFRDDPATLAMWQSERRMGRPRAGRVVKPREGAREGADDDEPCDSVH